MKILIINAGSSSLKYQLIDMDHESIIAKGLVERIGIEGGKLTHKYGDKTYTVTPDAIKDHTEAMNLVLEALLSKEHGVISSISEIRIYQDIWTTPADLKNGEINVFNEYFFRDLSAYYMGDGFAVPVKSRK